MTELREIEGGTETKTKKQINRLGEDEEGRGLYRISVLVS